MVSAEQEHSVWAGRKACSSVWLGMHGVCQGNSETNGQDSAFLNCANKYAPDSEGQETHFIM